MKYILLFTTLFGFTLLTAIVKADAWFDSVGYRYYHDLDNEKKMLRKIYRKIYCI